MLRNSLVFSVIVFLLSGCGGLRPSSYESHIGTAAHHVRSGFRLLEKGYLIDAEREFDLAIQHAGTSSSAYRGKALVAISDGRTHEGAGYMEKALDSALTNEDKAFAHIGLITVVRKEKKPGWLETAKSHFIDAILSGSCLTEAFFELGLCYKEAYEFARAREAFQRVVDMRGSKWKESQRELSLLHKIKRADPRTRIAVEWALRPSLTRAQFCVILVEEGRLPSAVGRLGRGGAASTLNGIPSDHELRPYIQSIAEMGFAGLSAEGSEGFQPDKPLTRKDFVLFLSDLIARLSGANRMDTVFGEGLLDSESDLMGEGETVGGADAIYCLKKIREKYPVFNEK